MFIFQVDEDDVDYNNINDILKLKFKLTLPADRILTSIMLMVDLDFQLKVSSVYS